MRQGSLRQLGLEAQLLRHLLTCSLSVIPAAGIPYGLQAQDIDQRIKEMASHQLATRYASMLPSKDIELLRAPPNSFSLEDFGVPTERWRVVRVTPLNDTHPPSLLVGQAGGELIRLGGFDEVDLVRANELLGDFDWTPVAIRARALLLAMLADPNGGVGQNEIVTCARCVEAGGGAVLRSLAALGQVDTIVVRSSGATVKLVLASERRGIGSSFEYFVFVCLFSSRGTLEAWSREAVTARLVQLADSIRLGQSQ
jgi:hypothetical protein